MGVELTHDVADDAGAFLERSIGPEPHLAHGMNDAPMHRLQAVADVRKRTMHDGRQGIGEITLFQRRLQVNRLNMIIPARRGSKALSHMFLLAQQTRNIKDFRGSRCGEPQRAAGAPSNGADRVSQCSRNAQTIMS
ncbi:hypothetical protein D3C72_1441860 [compost metagenome]